MDLKLFTTNKCGFCMMIEERIDKEKLNIKVININKEKEYVKVMMDKGGEMQVPMLLVDDEDAIYGYGRINSYIDENLENIK